MMAKTFPKLVAGGSCLVGILLLVAGIVGSFAEYRFAIGAVQTTGQIVSVVPTWIGHSHGKDEGTRPRYEYRVTYRYADQSGDYHEEQFTIHKEQYRTGANVDVEYLADAPDRSRVSVSWWVGWGWAVGLIVIGALLSGMGVLGLFCTFVGCHCQDDSGGS